MEKKKDKAHALRHAKKRPSNSSQAAALLPNSGGFRGFSRSSVTSETLSNELQLAFKKLHKKDATTKLKGLSEIASLVTKEASIEEVKAILANWVPAFTRLAHTNDIKVRVALHRTFLQIAGVAKKNMAPHLKTIIGDWVCHLFDPVKEVSTAAWRSFTAAIPASKHKEAVEFCKEELLQHLDTNLQQTPQTLSGGKADKAQSAKIEDRYVRVITSSLQALAFVLGNLSEASLAQNSEKLRSMLFDKRFTKFLNDKKYAVIRRSAYQVVTAMSTYLKPLVEENLTVIAASIFGILADADSITHQAGWEALLTFLNAYPESWKCVDARKQVLPRLWALLRNGTFGSPTVIYPSILPLISLVPASVVGTGTGFHNEFFTNLWKGLDSDQVTPQTMNSLQSCWAECIFYYASKEARALATDRPDVVPILIPYLLSEVVMPSLMEALLKLKNPPGFYAHLGELLKKLNNGPAYCDSMTAFWQLFVDRIKPKLLQPAEEDLCKELTSLTRNIAPVLQNDHRGDGNSKQHAAQRAFSELVQLLSAQQNKAGHLNASNLDFISTVTNICPQIFDDWQALGQDLISWIKQSVESNNSHACAESQDSLFTLVASYLHHQTPECQTGIWASLLAVVLHSQNVPTALQLLLQKVNSKAGTWVNPELDLYVLGVWETRSVEPLSQEQSRLLGYLISEMLVAEATKAKILADAKQELDRIIPLELSTQAAQPYLWLAMHTHMAGSAVDMSIINLLITAALWGTRTDSESSSPQRLEALTGWFGLCTASQKDEAKRRQILETLGTAILHFMTCATISTKLLAEFTLESLRHLACSTEAQSSFFLTSLVPFDEIWRLPKGISDIDHLAFAYISYPSQAEVGQQPNEILTSLISFVAVVTEQLPLEVLLLPDNTAQEGLTSSASALLLNILRTILYFGPSMADILGASEPVAPTAVTAASVQLARGVREFLKTLPIPASQSVLERAFSESYRQGELHSYTLALLLIFLFKRPAADKFAEDIITRYVLPQAASISDSASSLHTIQAVLPTLMQHVEPDLLRPIYESAANMYSSALSNILNRQKYDYATLSQAQLALEALSALYAVEPEYLETAARKQLSLLERIDFTQDKGHLLDVSVIRFINSVLAGDSSLVEGALWKFVFSFLQLAITRIFELTGSERERAHYRSACMIANIVALPDSIIATFDADSLALYHSFVSTCIIPTSLRLCLEGLRSTSTGTTRILGVINEAIRGLPSPLLLQRADIIEASASELYRMLFSPVLPGQKASYRLLLHLITADAKAAQPHASDTDGDGKVTAPLQAGLVAVIEAGCPSFESLSGTFGYWLAWSLVFDSFTMLSNQLRSTLTIYLRQSGALSTFLSSLFSSVDLQTKLTAEDITAFKIIDVTAYDARTMQVYATHLYLRALSAAPILVRQWWADDCDRHLAAIVDKYTTVCVSPLLVENDMAAIAMYKSPDDSFKVKAYPLSREVMATYEKDEMHMSIVLRLPASYPLRSVEIECKKKMGLSEGQWRKWVLSMTTLFLTQDASVLDAILLWKQNLDKHFEGVESCPICYSMFHITDMSLPKLACKTCHNKFHSACVYKWIRVSHNNECPLCKSVLI